MDKCESCEFYPPSSFGGKPCSFCDTSNPYMNCYRRREIGKHTYASALKEMDTDEMTKLICDIVESICEIKISYESMMMKLESYMDN